MIRSWKTYEILMKFCEIQKSFPSVSPADPKKIFFGNGFPVHFMVQGIHFHQKNFLGFAVERLVKFCEKISSIVGRI